MSRRGRAAAACLGLLLGVAAHAVAATAQTTARHVSAVDLFAIAERAKAAGRIEDALAIYEALSRDPNGEIRAEARFRQGMLLAAQHRYRDAAMNFRRLLDERPGAIRVRLELARVLAQIGDEDAAQRELRQARAAGLPPDVAVTVDQFARALRTTQRFGGSIEVALVPDSNVNRATDRRTLDTVVAPLTLSRDARARSGLGVKLAGQGFARVPVADRLSLLPRVSGLANLYGDHAFDDVSASALLGLEWRYRRDRITPSAGVTWRTYGGDPYARTVSAQIDWLHPAGTRAQWSASVSASRARYERNALQDGTIVSAEAGYERALSAASGIRAAMSADRQSARNPGYATWSGGGSILGWYDWGRTTVFSSLGVRRLEGDAALALFPAPRREWLIQASAGVTLRQLAVHRFAPVLRLGFERNFSTVGLYDYSRLSASMGVTRAF